MNLYAPDESHPSPYGSYLAACTFYASLYKESPINGDFPVQIEGAIAENIQKSAAEYVLTYYPKYHLDTIQLASEAILKIDFSIREEWLGITLYNSSPVADQYFWDFGNGKTSNQRNPKHYYAAPGNYSVTLHVRKGCNWFALKKTVSVSNKVKHANRSKTSGKH